jgi:hypothetical protein
MAHGAGWPFGKGFLERMEEFGKTIAEHFKRHIAYINVLKNTPVDCGDIAVSARRIFWRSLDRGPRSCQDGFFGRNGGAKCAKKHSRTLLTG